MPSPQRLASYAICIAVMVFLAAGTAAPARAGEHEHDPSTKVAEWVDDGLDIPIKAALDKLSGELGHPLTGDAIERAVGAARTIEGRDKLAEVLRVLKSANVAPEQLDKVEKAGARQIAWETLVALNAKNDPAVPVKPAVWQRVDTDEILNIVRQVPPKPSDPPGTNTNRDESMKAMAGLIGAALCVYQPEICPFVLVMLNSLGADGNVERDMALVRGIANAGESGNWTPDLIDSLAQRLHELGAGPQGDKLAPALGQLAGADPNAPLRKLLADAATKSGIFDKLREALPTPARNALDAALADKPIEDVLNCLERDADGPYFKSDEVKSVLGASVLSAKGGDAEWLKKYWDQGLAKVRVKG